MFFARCVHDVIRHSRINVVKGFSSLGHCLEQLVSNYLESATLHLTVRPRQTKHFPCEEAMKLLFNRIPALPITCDIHNVSLEDSADSLIHAYHFGAIVHFSDEVRPRGGNASALALQLAVDINEILESEDDGDPPGHLFLCDVARRILSPEELAVSVNARDTARQKLFKLLDSEREVNGSQWDYYTSRVTLVDPGVGPTEADIAASERKRFVDRQTGGTANC